MTETRQFDYLLKMRIVGHMLQRLKKQQIIKKTHTLEFTFGYVRSKKHMYSARNLPLGNFREVQI
jgi:hypothetical protein